MVNKLTRASAGPVAEAMLKLVNSFPGHYAVSETSSAYPPVNTRITRLGIGDHGQTIVFHTEKIRFTAPSGFVGLESDGSIHVLDCPQPPATCRLEISCDLTTQFRALLNEVHAALGWPPYRTAQEIAADKEAEDTAAEAARRADLNRKISELLCLPARLPSVKVEVTGPNTLRLIRPNSKSFDITVVDGRLTVDGLTI